MKQVAVILPAGGSGQRMGGPRKQFRTLGEHPVAYQTAQVFATHPDIHQVVLVVPKTEQASTTSPVADLPKVHVIQGGETRQASVRQGLTALVPEVEYILIHDAVRPFITPAQISAVISAVRTQGACALAVPVADTLRKVQHNTFAETVSRTDLFRMQTPQAFRRHWLEAAHKQAEEKGVVATDDVALVQALGHPVQYLQGHLDNIKITTPSDWAFAQAYWPIFKQRKSL